MPTVVTVMWCVHGARVTASVCATVVVTVVGSIVLYQAVDRYGACSAAAEVVTIGGVWCILQLGDAKRNDADHDTWQLQMRLQQLMSIVTLLSIIWGVAAMCDRELIVWAVLAVGQGVIVGGSAYVVRWRVRRISVALGVAFSVGGSALLVATALCDRHGYMSMICAHVFLKCTVIFAAILFSVGLCKGGSSD